MQACFQQVQTTYKKVMDMNIICLYVIINFNTITYPTVTAAVAIGMKNVCKVNRGFSVLLFYNTEFVTK